MLTTPHAAAGITLGVLIGNPVLVVPVAIASHFLLDRVPHWQETLAPYKPTWKTYIRVPMDITLAVIVTVWATHVAPEHAVAIWSGSIAATVPDLDTLVVLVPSIKRGLVQKYWDWHCRIQRETGSLWGVIPQLAVMAVAVVSVQLI